MAFPFAMLVMPGKIEIIVKKGQKEELTITYNR